MPVGLALANERWHAEERTTHRPVESQALPHRWAMSLCGRDVVWPAGSAL